MLVAFLSFRFSFRRLPFLWGQLNLPQFSAYVERAPIPKAIYFDCDRCQELIWVVVVSMATAYTNYIRLHLKQKGNEYLVLLNLLLPPVMNMPSHMHPLLTKFTFQRDGMRRNLKLSKHTLIDWSGLVCYLGGWLLCCVVFFGLVPKKPMCLGQSFPFDGHKRKKKNRNKKKKKKNTWLLFICFKLFWPAIAGREILLGWIQNA